MLALLGRQISKEQYLERGQQRADLIEERWAVVESIRPELTSLEEEINDLLKRW